MISQSIEDINSAKICPYCFRRPVYVDSKIVYGKTYGMIYFCKACDAYVGVHKSDKSNPKKSLGRLANKKLRDLKKQAHDHFDKLWQRAIKNGRSKHEARNSAYIWLSEEMKIDSENCHIGYFNEFQCQEAIRICRKYLTTKELKSL